MASRPISQREARRNLKELTALQRALDFQARAWNQQYLGGVEIAALSVGDVTAACIRTARKLKRAVVVTSDDSTTIRFIALPHPKVGS